MKSELFIDVQPSEVSIALTEDNRLVSLQKEARNIAYAVGDIYLAKVKKLMPGLNAAFVDVGYDKDAFLHYLDLGSQFASYREFLKQAFDDKKHLQQTAAAATTTAGKADDSVGPANFAVHAKQRKCDTPQGERTRSSGRSSPNR